jgi:hypothetical protein
MILNRVLTAGPIKDHEGTLQLPHSISHARAIENFTSKYNMKEIRYSEVDLAISSYFIEHL